MATEIKVKRPCCQSSTRCKRCPVVLKRLERLGVAERKSKRRYVVQAVTKRQLRVARVR